MADPGNIWTTKEIVYAIVATGIVSAVASSVVDLIKASYGRKNAARYGAIRSAIALERYAVDCWEVFIMGEGEFTRYHEMSRVRLPSAPEMPGDVDWKAVDATIADEVLSFSNVTGVVHALAAYADQWESNPYDYHDAAKVRGLEALKLAGRIRKHYGMSTQKDFDLLWKDFTK